MARALLAFLAMKQGDVDFDHLFAELVEDETSRKHTITGDPWDFEAASAPPRDAKPKRRRVAWLIPTVGTGLIIGGATIPILGGHGRSGAIAQETKASDSSFTTIAPAAPRGMYDPVV